MTDLQLPGLDPAPHHPTATAWAALPGPARYPHQWRRLAAAATAAGIRPHELPGRFDELVAVARWKPATAALYAKVARYGGLAVAGRATPEPAPIPTDVVAQLTRPTGTTPAACRDAAWATAAWDWPAPLHQWRQLRLRDLELTHRPGGPQLTIAGRPTRAGTAWAAWHQARVALLGPPGPDDYALCTVRAGRHLDARQGGPLAARSAQAAFARHSHLAAARAADEHRDPALVALLRTLTYDTYRRAALTAGIDPVADPTRPQAPTRGTVRAQRTRRRR